MPWQPPEQDFAGWVPPASDFAASSGWADNSARFAGIESSPAPSPEHLAPQNPLMGMRAGNPFAPGVSSMGTEDFEGPLMSSRMGPAYLTDATAAGGINAGLAAGMAAPTALSLAARGMQNPYVMGAYGGYEGYKRGGIPGAITGAVAGAGGSQVGKLAGALPQILKLLGGAGSAAAPAAVAAPVAAAEAAPALGGVLAQQMAGKMAAGVGQGVAGTVDDILAMGASAAAPAAEAAPAAVAAAAPAASAAPAAYNELLAFARQALPGAPTGSKVWMLLKDGKPVSVLTPDQAGAASRAGEMVTWVKALF